MKKYKRNLIIIFALACFVLLRFMTSFEDMAGIQTRNPDMDTYEIHNDLYYYSSYESVFFTYEPSTKEIVKLSNKKASDSSIYFQSGYVFFMEYRGSSIVRMDENGDNEKVLFE